MRGAVILTIGVLLLGGCTRTSMGLVPYYCAHPRTHPVLSRREAILRARKVWYCIEWNEKKASEEAWLANFAATRTANSWDVVTMMPDGYVGPMIFVSLSASDGSVIDVRFSQ